MMEANTTLVLFCKRPKLAQGKQRLATELGLNKTLEIANTLLACAIEDARTWLGPVVIACAHQEDLEWAQGLLDKAQVIYQGEGNLGQRINHIDRTLRAQGQHSLIFIGSDSPMMDERHYLSIKHLFYRGDVVICKAEDGGVIAMANKKPWPDLSALPWSTQYLASALAKQCLVSDLSVSYGRGGFDIDYLDDLIRLADYLKDDLRCERQYLLRQLETLFQSSPINSPLNLPVKAPVILDMRKQYA